MRCSALQVARHVPHTIQNPNPDTIHRPYVCCVKQSINAYMTRTARSRLPPARRRTKTWTIEKGASRREEKNRCTTLCRSDYVTPATAPSEGIFIRVHRKKRERPPEELKCLRVTSGTDQLAADDRATETTEMSRSDRKLQRAPAQPKSFCRTFLILHGFVLVTD